MLRRVLSGLLESSFHSWRLVVEEIIYWKQSQVTTKRATVGRKHLQSCKAQREATRLSFLDLISCADTRVASAAGEGHPCRSH